MAKVITYLINNDIMNIDKAGLDADEVLKSLAELIELVDSENILKMPNYSKFGYENTAVSKGDLQLNQVVFELTEKCNLRCKYCIYNEYNGDFRNFTSKDMPWEMLKNGLDYIKAHSEDKIIIVFYGGEPLLKFDMIKKAINYYGTIKDEKQEVIYTMTTNMTLVTEEMANYLASVKNMRIVCSFDGPKHIQNEFRVFENENRTFKKAQKGLKYLANAFKNKEKNSLSINMVLCPPYSEDKFNELCEFFDNLGLPENAFIHYNYVERNTLPKKYETDFHIDYKNSNFLENSFEESDPMKFWAMNKLSDSTLSKSWFLSSIERNDLMEIQSHYLVDHPLTYLNRNGCCIPGHQRLYITSQGDFKICERVGEVPLIGSLKNGINLKNIEDFYINDYDKKSSDCKRCWACHLCTLCYSSSMRENGTDPVLKKESCHAMQIHLRNNLIEYYQILENNPSFIKEYIERGNDE